MGYRPGTCPFLIKWRSLWAIPRMITWDTELQNPEKSFGLCSFHPPMRPSANVYKSSWIFNTRPGYRASESDWLKRRGSGRGLLPVWKEPLTKGKTAGKWPGVSVRRSVLLVDWRLKEWKKNSKSWKWGARRWGALLWGYQILKNPFLDKTF